MSFRITGLPANQFADIFSLSDDELIARRAVRQKPEGSVPCRISLTDSQPGEEVVLINHQFQPAETPYHGTFAIYIREGEQTYDEIDQVPDQLRRRMLSIKAYDSQGMIITATLTKGDDLEAMIPEFMEDERVAYLHVHFATYGCYAARVDRA